MLTFITVAPSKQFITRSSTVLSQSLSSQRQSQLSCSSFLPKHAFLPQQFTSTRSQSTSSTPTMAAISELTGMKDIEGKPLDASIFSGKVVFAMNVASACGYTKSGYELLNRLTNKFSPDDFVAVALPCNGFLFQENGTEDEIKTFALSRAEKLIITERTQVNGNSPHPIVGLAKQKFPGRINWNFDGRFVFDRNGQPTARFGNDAKPDEIEAAIEKLI